jgi:uncharacterized delta-60 repeat protein
VIFQGRLIGHDGKLILVGSSAGGLLAKLAPTGSLDAVFGSEGKSRGSLNGWQDDAVLVQDGKILTVGQVFGDGTGYDISLIRYLPDGTLDSSFANGGMFSLDIAGLKNDDKLQAVAITPNGKYLVAGRFAGREIGLAQFNTDGTLDLGFGSGGIVRTSFSENSHAFDVVVLDNGSAVVTGTIGSDISVLRYRPDGALDKSFGIEGVTRVDLGGGEIGYSLLVGDDGDIYIGGTSDSDFILLRLNSNGSLDVDFPKPPGVSGIAYHWKSHAILGDISLQALKGSEGAHGPNSPIQFKNPQWNADGHVTFEVWASSENGAENLTFEVNVESGALVSFTPDISIANWVSNQEFDGAEYTFAGMALDSDLAIPSGMVKVGTLKFIPGDADSVRLFLSLGEVGQSRSSPFSLSFTHPLNGEEGIFSFGELPAGDYSLSAHRDTGDINRAITAADALAVLKIAVGLNPNTDPDGEGPRLTPKVSPYQFMAADVVGSDGRVTSADALAVLKMAVRMRNSVEPEWMFVEESRDFWDEAANSGQGAFTLSRKNALWDRTIQLSREEHSQEVNLVGVLKGDVNGSWMPPEGSWDLDKLVPTYFQDLSLSLGAPLDQWHV